MYTKMFCIKMKLNSEENKYNKRNNNKNDIEGNIYASATASRRQEINPVQNKIVPRRQQSATYGNLPLTAMVMLKGFCPDVCKC